MKPLFFALLAGAGLSASASASKDHRGLVPVRTGQSASPRAGASDALPAAETLALPAGETADAAILPFDPLDFSEVVEAQSLLAAGNSEIGATIRVHDAVREAAFRSGGGIRASSMPQGASDVNFDGTDPKAETSPRPEVPGFYDVLGSARRDGARKRYGAGKGVEVYEFVLELDGHRLLLQDIEGRWPSEFYMTRVFFFRNVPGAPSVQVKTDGEGNVTGGKPEDLAAELLWWRERLDKKKKPA